MLNRDKRRSIIDKDREVVAEVIKNRTSIEGIKLDHIRKKYDEIQKEIDDLHDEKMRLLEAAITKEEILKYAKSAIDAGRNTVIADVLKPYLRRCQETNSMPFHGPDMRVHLFPESKAWMLFFLAIREEDLEEVMALLPNIGTPIKERDAKIQEIDNQIELLSKQLKDELEELKR